MTRLSRYFLPTEKEAPADAEAPSHKLMVRAGLVRQLGAGLWSWLPAGWRVHENVSQIVREELDAIGAQEMLMPVLNPAELWQRSGRYGIEELFKLKDRRGADLVLAMTHEEVVTTHVAPAVRSYRDLPFSLYHFQTKGRDEARPRAGVLRTREFIMKDAYTFDRDREGLDAQYEQYREAYDRIFDRIGLEWYRVESDVGMMGGVGAHEYMAPCPAGENEVALAPGYAANTEVATADAQPVELPDGIDAPLEVPTPGLTTVAEVAQSLRVPAGSLLKAYPVIVEDRGLTLVVVRGDHRVNDVKLANALGAPFRPAREDEFAEPIGPAGYIGPVGIDVPILLDDAVEPGAYITGANRRTRTCAASSRAATSRSSAATCAASSPATPSAACRSGSSPRSRSATSSSSARASPNRSARPTWTSRASRSRSGWARTGSARRASPPPPSSSSRTSTASRGRARSPRSTSTSSVSARRTATSAPSPSGCTASCSRPACGSSTTTATAGRARSSPTPSCSACRCG